jgi:hypothetical protein
MLDDLNDGMDNTQRRLTRETQHVVHVSEKAKAGGISQPLFHAHAFLSLPFAHAHARDPPCVTGMFCCIFLLIVAIIVVAAIPH